MKERPGKCRPEQDSNPLTSTMLAQDIFQYVWSFLRGPGINNNIIIPKKNCEVHIQPINYVLCRCTKIWCICKTHLMLGTIFKSYWEIMSQISYIFHTLTGSGLPALQRSGFKSCSGLNFSGLSFATKTAKIINIIKLFPSTVQMKFH